MKYYNPSHTSVAMDRICILGARGEKHRDRGEAESATSLQRAPTALPEDTAHSPGLQHHVLLTALLPGEILGKAQLW